MKPIVFVVTGALALGAACVRLGGDGLTVGQKLDRLVAQTTQAIVETSDGLAWPAGVADDAILAFADSISERALVRALDVPDAGVSASIKKELVRDPELSGARIDVEAKDGVVLLSGEASALRHRERAEQIAWANRAVVRVENNVAVSGD